ncbi:MAG: DNA-directed RNA polymerase subunit D [Nanoarchaeota archaeon]|nr:DNA-directed RNA polymerase subunit D [Nanoarchaeota archaeon]
MTITTLKKEKNKLIFTIQGINYVTANTLRRIMTAEVPTLAVETVEFTKNMSVLYDEVIAHRIGLIPIKTDLKSYNLREECKCKGKGCAMCQLKFSLKVAGPCTVMSSELKSKDPKCTPAYPDMPIVTLEKNKKLELTATAKLGKGKEHTKFIPGLVYYRAYPKIQIKSCNEPEKCARACPKKILEVKNQKLIVTRIEECDLCNACSNACPDCITTGQEQDKFIFFIESWGQLSPKEIFLKAIIVLNKKVDEFAKDLKKSKPD